MANDSTGFNPLLGHPKYEFVGKIKDAMFGVVVLARNKDSKEEVAIRFFDNRQDAMLRVLRCTLLPIVCCSLVSHERHAGALLITSSSLAALRRLPKGQWIPLEDKGWPHPDSRAIAWETPVCCLLPAPILPPFPSP